MSVTAKELARKLNLSESAISLALNHRPGVSTATRRRVIEAAKACGYDFSRLRSAAEPTTPSGSVCFVIYRKHGAVVTDTPFFAQLAEGIDAACRQFSCFLNIHYLYEGDDVEAQLADWQRTGTKGIILLGTEMSQPDLSPFLGSTIPLILLDNYFETINIDSVLINNVQGAFTATSFLIRRYRSQPGYLHSSYPVSNFKERANGFYKAIRESGMSPSRSPVHHLAPSAEGAYSDMTELLAAGESPARSYFADNDLIAAGAMRAFRESGLRIPQDVALIGFDALPLCTFTEPSLSTIRVPKQYMGILAVRRLHERITGRNECPLKIEIATTLIKRGSL